MPALRSGTLYQKTSGGVYYVRWMVNGKVFTRSTGATTKAAAEDKRREIMAPYAVGSESDMLANVAGRLAARKADLVAINEKEHPPLLIASAWDAYEATANRPDSGEGTLGMYEGQWERFAKWSEKQFPGSSLRDVDPARARGYADDLSKAGLSANTFNKHIGLLALVFRSLADEGRVTVNPWDRIQRKRAMGHSRRELTVEELRRVCGSATGEMRTLLAIGLYTGLRLGDAATLQWSEVDMVRGEVRRVPNKTGRHNPRPVIVPLHSTLATMLAEMPAKGRTGAVLPELCRRYEKRRDLVSRQVQHHLQSCGVGCNAPGKGKKPTTGEDGKPAAKKAAGAKGKPKKAPAAIEVGFHSLRHSFVSLCRAADVPLSVVESIVGHSSPAMTRHYTHTGELAARTAVNTLPDVTALLGEADSTAKDAASTKEGGEATLRAEVARLAEGLTSKNAATTRKALLALVKGAGVE